MWLRKAGSVRSKKPEPDHVYFADCLEIAESLAKARAIGVITAAVLKGSVEAAKFWLEKHHAS